jgi:hypothetical protein
MRIASSVMSDSFLGARGAGQVRSENKMVAEWKYVRVGLSDLGIVGRTEGALFMATPDICKSRVTSTERAVEAC